MIMTLHHPPSTHPTPPQTGTLPHSGEVIWIHKLRKGLKKNVKLGLLAEVRGGVRVGFRGPTCYWVSFLMLKNGLKMHENYDIT